MALKVIESIIKIGQQVSDRTLHLFSDVFYLSQDRKQREESFVILDLANHNQDLSDELFVKLEIERAGYTISKN